MWPNLPMTKLSYGKECGEDYSLKDISAGLPHRCRRTYFILVALSRYFEMRWVTKAAFSDNTEIIRTGNNTETPTKSIHLAVKMSDGQQNGHIKLSQSGRPYINFKIKSTEYLPTVIIQQAILRAISTKNMGMNIDANLTRKARLKKKCEELGKMFKKMW